jgi:uncharacterized membrane protein
MQKAAIVSFRKSERVKTFGNNILHLKKIVCFFFHSLPCFCSFVCLLFVSFLPSFPDLLSRKKQKQLSFSDLLCSIYLIRFFLNSKGAKERNIRGKYKKERNKTPSEKERTKRIWNRL